LLNKVIEGDRNISKYLTLIGQTGLTMVISIVAGLLLGVWLDQKFSSQPLFLAIFILLGIFVGFFSCYKLIVRFFNINEVIAEPMENADDNS